MSTSINTIVTGIKGLISTSLGSSYISLPYAYDINNNSKIVAKGYSVIPQGLSEVDGVSRSIYVDQTFQIIVNDKYLSSTTNDTAKQDLIMGLYNKMLDIYQSIVVNKAGAPSIVLIVNNMSIGDPEILEDNDFVSLRMDINVKHRYNF